MRRKIEIGLCLMITAGFMAIWGFSKSNNLAIMTSGNLATMVDKQVVVLDAGHGAYALTVVA